GGEDGSQFRVLHVMRTGVGRENPTRRQALHRAQVDLLVPAQRPLERALGFRERRWIKYDQIPRLLATLAEVIEDVRDTKLRVHLIALRILPRLRDRIVGAVNTHDRGRSRPRRMKREGALVAERVEHPPAGGMRCDARVLLALVEIKARLLPLREIQPMLEAVDRHPTRLPRATRSGTDMLRQPLQPANGRVVAMNDLRRLKQFVQ